MAMHDSIDEKTRPHPDPESLADLAHRSDRTESQPPSSTSFGNDRKDDLSAATDNFGRTLLSAWLIAALLAIAMLLVQPSSDAPPGYSVGPSMGQAPSSEIHHCSELDYAYRWC